MDVLRDAWVLSDVTWQSGDALMLQVPTDSHAPIGFWSEDTQHLDSWHLHLQEPLRRTPLGCEPPDHILAIVVSLDRRSWAWKDEASFAETVRRGLVTPEAASGNRQ